jgi:uncharacterized protein YdiU (UPF0061 family)
MCRGHALFRSLNTRSLLTIIWRSSFTRCFVQWKPAYEKGAIVARVLHLYSVLKFFEIFAAREDHENLKLLTDYTIKHHFPQIQKEGIEKYLALFKKLLKLRSI